MKSKISPVQGSERYQSLDLLRGIAVLGILVMNIQSFSMIDAAYLNPTAYGDLTGMNKLVWILSHIFTDQKFMTIFSILFGAGIIIITNRADSKGVSAAGLHYRRTLWLLIIGLIHAYLIWHGDILVSYALCAFIAFLFRKLSPKKLFIIGILLILINSLIYSFFGWTLQNWPPDAINGIMETWNPCSETIEKQVTIFRGEWSGQIGYHVFTSIFFQTFVFAIWTGWRAGGLMLIGMALYKWNVLTAGCSGSFYKKGSLIGLSIGIPIIIVGVIKNFQHNFTLEYSMFYGWQYNHWGSLLVSFGYICIIMLITKSFQNNKVIKLLSGVGRMALTNYILQSLICTTIFYGHGFGLYGQVERKFQILIVFVVWVVVIIFTNIWLKYFIFGPVEWLWRSLTYLKIQPIRIK